MSDHDHIHPAPKTFLLKYVFSIDHKIISLQFLFSSILFVILGGLFALGVRYQIAWPNQNVPYKWILPGKMTQVAPEANVGLWKPGQEVIFTADTDGIPAGATAELTGFPKGFAVEIPKYTIVVGDSGRSRTLQEPVTGFVATNAVMGDYDYKKATVRAVVGTTVVTESGAELTLTGTEQIVPSVGGAGHTVIHEDPLLLPVKPELTVVSLHVPKQKVPEVADGDAPQVDVEAKTIESTLATSVKLEKDALTADAYLQLFTMHASIMIFFVIIPTLIGFFGNWAIPLMIGARDMAFPKLNMLSFWLSFPAGLIMLVSFWTMNGPAGGGWTMYPTLSELKFSSQIGTTLWIISVGLVGFSSVVGALNYITTIINMRSPGMSMFRMPLTIWSLFITSALSLLGTPVLTAAMVLLLIDRHLGGHFFTPDMGGQPLLFQHLFWFYSHPAVYIMILPTMGLASDVLSTFSRKPIFGYKPMIFAMGSITGLGFIVWGHHMFQSGMNPVLGTTFMASTIMIAVPSAIKTFNWLGTIWGGNVKFTPPMLNAIGFVSMFVIGGLSGIFMASTPVDIQIHDTYFIVAHIHYVLFGGAIFGIFAGVYYWFPKIFGVQMNQRWGVVHFILTFIAFNGTFFLMHVLGVGGHPRRYASIMEYPTLIHLQPMNVLMSLWAMSLGLAQIPFFYNLWVSMPRKVGRALAASFAAMLIAPATMGMVYWSASDAAVFTDIPVLHGAINCLITTGDDGGYTPFAVFGGNTLLIIALIALTVMCFKQLTPGGKWATAFTLVPTVIYAIAIPLLNKGGSLAFSQRADDSTPVDETVAVIRNIFWSPLTADIMVAIGWGVLFGVVIVGLTWLVWAIGGMLRLPALINNILWVIVLPMYLLPFIVKQDIWVYIGHPTWHNPLLWFVIFSLPGLAYRLINRQRDAFGYACDINPWQANTLEWTIPSPPPHYNFEHIPTVYRGPYEYSSPVVEEDYLTQTKQLPAGVVEPTGH